MAPGRDGLGCFTGGTRAPYRCFLLAVCLLWAAAPSFANDGVGEINDARALAGGVIAGDAPGYPVTLSAAGSYVLTGALSWSGNDTTIVVCVVALIVHQAKLILGISRFSGIYSPAFGAPLGVHHGVL